MREDFEGLFLILMVVLLVCLGVIIGDGKRNTRCLEWIEQTGGDFRRQDSECQIRINKDTWIPHRELNQNLGELDLSYVEACE